MASEFWLPSLPVSAKSRDVHVSSPSSSTSLWCEARKEPDDAVKLRFGIEWACTGASTLTLAAGTQEGSVVGASWLVSNGSVTTVGVAVSVALLLLSSIDVCLGGFSQMTRTVWPSSDIIAFSSCHSSVDAFLPRRNARLPPLRRFSWRRRLSLLDIHRGMFDKDLNGLGCRLRRLRAGSV